MKKPIDTTIDSNVFASLLAACEYLVSKGYKVSESKIYRDKNAGKITLEQDGKSISTKAVWEYAEEYLEKTGVNGQDLSDIQSQKEYASLELKEEQIKKVRFQREKEEGKYILRSEFEKELASRAVVLDAGFRHLFNMRASEWVAIVNGQPDKSSDLLSALNNGLDEQLRAYASLRSFYVVFGDE